MNKALRYLWWCLLKRRLLQALRSLRRPTTLLGFLAVVGFVATLFYYRSSEAMAQVVRKETLLGGALVMVGGSLFKGFLERGLAFSPPDIEFLFTSPFTQRQLLFYRLSSQYLFAVVQSAVFFLLFASHFAHPGLVALCLTLFQIACFHLSTAAAMFAGTLSDDLHHRIRWMMLGAYFFLTALYLRLAWDLKIVPAFLASPLAQLAFYPAVMLPDVASSPGLHYLAFKLSGGSSAGLRDFWQPTLWTAGFAAAAALTLWLLLRLKADIYEASLATTTQRSEKRIRLRQGSAAPVAGSTCSVGLPRFALFRGVGALIWKNLVVARRSRRDLVLMFVFALVYTGFVTALLGLYHHLAAKAGGAPPSEAQGFHLGIAAFLASLTFFLQRMVPFDFRRDGRHLVAFRTLPLTPLGIAVAEIAVPTLFCLALQVPCLVALLIYGRFPWFIAVLLVAVFPAVALALNSVWNLHYLLTAGRNTSGRSESPSAVGTLIVVALSFLVFCPAGWTAQYIGQHMSGNVRLQFPLAGGLGVQYLLDVLLILLLAKLFQRFEFSRDA